MTTGKDLKLHVLSGDPPVEVKMRRSPRARRFSLRVSHADGQVSLSLPKWAPEREALEFLHSREDWVRAQLARRPEVKRPEIGGTIPVCGSLRSILPSTGRVARFEDGQITVPNSRRCAPLIAALLKALARDRLIEASDRYSAALGLPYSRLTLRDTKSRWGSCSTAGHLMFSWRLIMAPPEVLDYVAAHEVAHLAEMNHSDKFWKTCERLFPDYKAQRAWLRANGSDLLAWRFDSLQDTPDL